jgi:Ion channel
MLGSNASQSLGREMIMSGDAFFTLGYGDIVPRHAIARLLIILEAGTGFGFIALTVSYLPVLAMYNSSNWPLEPVRHPPGLDYCAGMSPKTIYDRWMSGCATGNTGRGS